MLRLDGLAELAGAYDGFIVDLWGVVHDGVAPYPGALECLARLNQKPVLLLSNAPRRAWAVKRALDGLGVSDCFYSAVLTSGEATWQALYHRSDPWFRALGKRVYHLGPARDRSVLEDLALDRVACAEEADFVLNTGPDDARDDQNLEVFTLELKACLEHHLPMICANPDLEVVRGGVRILCAGALALYYAEMGGVVRWVGKPSPEIYEQALSFLALDRTRVLAIGDSLRTDIAGAQSADIDAVWALSGVHASLSEAPRDLVENEARLAGLKPVATIPRLIW